MPFSVLMDKGYVFYTAFAPKNRQIARFYRVKADLVALRGLG